MSALDAIAGGVAAEVIEQFGADVIIRRSGTDYDPTTGKKVGEPEPETVKATPPDPWTETTSSGRIVPTKDARFIVAGSAISSPPKNGDILEHAGTKYVITDVQAVWSGAEVAAWQIRGRL